MARLLEGILGSCDAAGGDVVLWDEHGAVTGHELLDDVAAWCALYDDTDLRPGQIVSLALSEARTIAPAVVAAWLRRLTPALHNPLQGQADLGGALQRLGWPPLMADHLALPVARRLGVPVVDAASVMGLAPRWHGEIPEEDARIVGFTSGTTGRQKALLHIEPRILRNYAEYESVLGVWGRGATLVVLPTYLLPATLPSLFFSLWLGNPAVVLAKFTVAGYAEAVRRHDVDYCMAVPAVYRGLLEAPDFDGEGIARVRWHLCGAAAIDDAAREAFQERFGGAISPVSGSTEVAGYLSLSRRPGVAAPGSAGRPLPHLGVTVLDDDDSILPSDQVGEIAVAADAIFAGYGDGSGGFSSVEADDHGLFRTGDLGYLDEGGDLFLVGRTATVVNRGGFKVYPAEVERVAADCAGVGVSVLVGVPDSRLGEVPVLYLEGELEAMASEAEVAAHLRDQLAPYKVPARIVRCPSRTLPRTNFEKIDSARLDGSVPAAGTYADFGTSDLAVG